MKCPTCTEPDLTVTMRHGIEIDLCPRCRGVWLDRGELEKILARVNDDHEGDDDDYHRERSSSGRSRRKSWWMELLD